MKSLLNVKNLHVETAGKQVLRGLNLSIAEGEVCALMGPNGSGKSTLALTLAGRETCSVTQGKILYDGKNLLDMNVEERARAGLFLAFQHPVEMPGVRIMTFLRAALEARQVKNSPASLLKQARETAQDLLMPETMLRRSVHEGFSGGEKKRLELLQMLILKPRLIILDEIDSGLDVDGLKLAAQAARLLKKQGAAILFITHYRRMLDLLHPDRVHILENGAVVRSGDAALAAQVDEDGYQAANPMPEKANA